MAELIVQPPRKRHPLEEAALRLRAAGGTAYDEFLNAFEAYLREVTDAVTDAPPEQILGAQGQSRQVRKLLKLLKDANK